MAQVKSPLTSAALSLIGWPLGVLLAVQAVGFINQLGGFFSQSISLSAGGVVVSLPVMWGMLRWALPQKDEISPGLGLRIARGFVLFSAATLSILFLNMLSNLSIMVGNALVEPLGKFGFLGNFIFQLGDSLRMITPAVVAFGGGSLLGGFGSRIGQTTSDQAGPRIVKALNLLVTALAGAVLFALVGAVIDWFYQIDNLIQTLWIPGGVGAAIGIILAAITEPKEALPIGNAMYYVVRTILNAIRSVEPLVMVIVFVVWVGIGPFAGALALGLHTVAALAKLFSEQVESILPGPLEAVQATGANRLQTIVYAVVPQIIPPYISFTMYRWDINVRMSTIIGFAGGGGIGFLLQQNIRLLDYRAASTQMLAIALVVASMDYVSSVIRERYV
jgi:phosphonate ABC transporter permease subunit PhnE